MYIYIDKSFKSIEVYIYVYIHTYTDTHKDAEMEKK